MKSTVHCTGTMVLSMFVAHVVGTHVSAQVVPDLEVHFTFDDENEPELDSSGNDRHGEIDGAQWVDDPEREGALEFLGGNDGFVRVEIPELPGDDFTIAFWVYRDSVTATGGNDGLFQVQIGGDVPSTSTKVIGAWVAGTGGVWGRLRQQDGTQLNLDRATFLMDSDAWVHLAYRGDGQIFEVVVNGESGVGPAFDYDGTLEIHDTVFIGKQGTESWGGRIDDFRVYRRALTDEEIATIMTGEPPAPKFLRGDADGNGMLQITDAIATLNFLFVGNFTPTCMDALDWTDDGGVEITDAVASLDHQFSTGDPSPAPGSQNCGPDPTDDPLDCESFEACQ